MQQVRRARVYLVPLALHYNTRAAGSCLCILQQTTADAICACKQPDWPVLCRFLCRLQQLACLPTMLLPCRRLLQIFPDMMASDTACGGRCAPVLSVVGSHDCSLTLECALEFASFCMSSTFCLHHQPFCQGCTGSFKKTHAIAGSKYQGDILRHQGCGPEP